MAKLHEWAEEGTSATPLNTTNQIGKRRVCASDILITHQDLKMLEEGLDLARKRSTASAAADLPLKVELAYIGRLVDVGTEERQISTREAVALGDWQGSASRNPKKWLLCS